MTHTPMWEGARPKLDPMRVRRAMDHDVAELSSEPGSYLVTSPSGGIRYVTVSPYYNCECPDAQWRNIICKHIIAALLAWGDEEAAEIATTIQKGVHL